MRRLVLLILALATLLPSLSHAYDVLVLQSRRDPAYDEVLKGFRLDQKKPLRVLVLADYAEIDIVRIVREEHPKLILAIGDAALTTARRVETIPVVAVMALGIHNRKSAQPNLTGIGMYVPPAHYIRMFKSLKTRRIGVIYNPARSGWYLRQARQAAEEAGIILVTREVAAPRKTTETLSSLAGTVDAIWMLPDSTAVTRETTEAYFNFGQQQGVPVISFAANYLGLGAAVVLEIDRMALGRQADAMIAALLEGDGSVRTPFTFPDRITVKTNANILRRLGSSVTEE